MSKTAISIMEQKARHFPITSRGTFSLLEKKDREETLDELKQLREILVNLSKNLKVARDIVKEKEKQFTHLANYKNLLERVIILPRLISPPSSGGKRKKKEDNWDKLAKRLEALSPAQLKVLEEMEL